MQQIALGAENSNLVSRHFHLLCNRLRAFSAERRRRPCRGGLCLIACRLESLYAILEVQIVHAGNAVFDRIMSPQCLLFGMEIAAWDFRLSQQ
ncbi:hypothetical protein EAO27_05915 [Sphingopyxis sp. YF1]|uniref:hypothetical protein n=1 Tax=Sphingopyxis sp. YF1 TaxID=2482763 RepID=UPI001F61C520|nr:hypothetical protein [Sphingopyxis sp. YF1]UNU42294.1 hypothetical protein EAO27_05915 [Sphingopyxis sp. YF1]